MRRGCSSRSARSGRRSCVARPSCAKAQSPRRSRPRARSRSRLRRRSPPRRSKRRLEKPSDDPYIETSRCTTCNECTQINDKMFGYDANKQASIVNPDAGTYRQLVEAAESCQVSIIHPGKPRNPDEPGPRGAVGARRTLPVGRPTSAAADRLSAHRGRIDDDDEARSVSSRQNAAANGRNRTTCTSCRECANSTLIHCTIAERDGR